MTATPNPKKKPATGKKTTVAIQQETHRQLMKSAKELGVNNGEYASAAISYFTERGLNPIANREREGAVIQKRIGDVEQLIVNLGNRLFGWLIQHEKNLNRDLFGFLRGHEKTLFDYLQKQETNVHEHLSDQEEMLLLPLLEEVMLTNVEALYSRRLGEQIMLKLLGREATEYPKRHQKFNEQRDKDAKQKLDTFVAKLAPTLAPVVSVPQPTPVPQRSQPAPSTATDAVKTALDKEPESHF